MEKIMTKFKMNYDWYSEEIKTLTWEQIKNTPGVYRNLDETGQQFIIIFPVYLASCQCARIGCYNGNIGTMTHEEGWMTKKFEKLPYDVEINLKHQQECKL